MFRRALTRLLGSGPSVRRLEVVHAAGHAIVLLGTLAGPPHRVVLKVAKLPSPVGTHFERTAAVTNLARSAGVPVPEVLAVDATGDGPWQYLVQEHVPGVPWRQVRPTLDDAALDTAHNEIADAVLAMQTIRFDGFGELDSSARPAGGTLIAALRRRADRIPQEADRTAFLHLLTRHEDLFVDAHVPATKAAAIPTPAIPTPATPTSTPATLCHDDLHHENVVFDRRDDGWHLAGLLDWDKAWAGPAESDIARMAFWDDMTGQGFWHTYRSQVPAASAEERRRPIYQLLWCLEYNDTSSRHAADTARLWDQLRTGP